jgi:uncharacterized protein (DUF1330 family)
MKAYLIAEIEVLDAQMYAEYTRAAQPIVMQYGGRYIVRGGNTLPISGDWNPERLLVLEFGSLTELQNCFACDAYKLIAPLRLASTRSRSVVVEGVPESESVPGLRPPKEVL